VKTRKQIEMRVLALEASIDTAETPEEKVSLRESIEELEWVLDNVKVTNEMFKVKKVVTEVPRGDLKEHIGLEIRMFMELFKVSDVDMIKHGAVVTVAGDGTHYFYKDRLMFKVGA